MENKLFLERADKIFRDCIAVMRTKGTEYMAGDNDRFANFKRIAKKYDIPTELVAAIYLEKHLDSITNFIKQRCKGGKSQRHYSNGTNQWANRRRDQLFSADRWDYRRGGG